MKEITIRCTWTTVTTVEVPDDFELSSSLLDNPDEVIEAMTTDGAELIDWEDAT